MRNFFSLALILLCITSLHAQQDSVENKKPAIHIGLAYQSNSVYLGRKDSLALPYVIPSIQFTTPSGFHLGASAYVLTSESRVDAYYLDAGYEFSKGNTYGGIGADAYVFNSQSVNVLAEASTGVNGYLGFNLPVVQPGINAALIFGKGSLDYITGLSLEHSFTTESENFSFTPGLFLNAGTQNYYSEYYQERKYNTRSGKGRGKKGSSAGSSGSATVTSVQTQETSQFKLLDYELAASIVYKTKNLSFSFEPRYAIPQNPSKVTITNAASNGAVSTQTFTEKLSNSFYWKLGLSYRLPL